MFRNLHACGFFIIPYFSGLVNYFFEKNLPAGLSPPAAFSGVPEVIRTPDLPLRRRSLYPAELLEHDRNGARFVGTCPFPIKKVSAIPHKDCAFVKYDGKFASRWRAKSPDALCAVLPLFSVFSGLDSLQFYIKSQIRLENATGSSTGMPAISRA